MSEFIEIKPEELRDNPFKLIGKDWALISAERDGVCNMMTASWGSLGVMWSKPCAFVFIRPERYTKEFVDANERFSLSFFENDMRKALNLCGTKSGRDIDKLKESGLTLKADVPAPVYEQARLTLICRKLYCQQLNAESELSYDVTKWYNGESYNGGYHYMYVGEIEKALVKKD